MSLYEEYDASYTNMWLVGKFYSARWYLRRNMEDGFPWNVKVWRRVMVKVGHELRRRGCVWRGRWEGPGINGEPQAVSTALADSPCASPDQTVIPVMHDQDKRSPTEIDV